MEDAGYKLGISSSSKPDPLSTIGTYFARFKICGKLICKSLKKNVYSVAQTRLPDLLKEHRSAAEVRQACTTGKLTFANARDAIAQKIEANVALKSASKHDHRLLLGFISISWKPFLNEDINLIFSNCAHWQQMNHSEALRSADSRCADFVDVLSQLAGSSIGLRPTPSTPAG